MRNFYAFSCNDEGCQMLKEFCLDTINKECLTESSLIFLKGKIIKAD